MEKKCSCSEETMSLPDEIVMSLRKYGGIAGLLKRLPDDETLASSGEIHKALSDPIRLKIMSMLGIQPLCVCVLKAGLGIADSRLSYHLSVMKKAGLIEGEQQGNWIIYSLTEEGGKWVL
ncbi:ArsR/SmtB family transcription factor [Methanolacinia petrolearia]|uniref:ArsR/SmtB family transcription factor n=1 Tax=Methanolacinia petrolearia TaxID=54120 RepID=UPI003BAACE1C